MIALRGAIHVACFHHSCLHKGVWRCLSEDVVIGNTPLFFSAEGNCGPNARRRPHPLLSRGKRLGAKKESGDIYGHKRIKKPSSQTGVLGVMIWLMLLKLFLVLPLLFVFFWPLIDAYQESADFGSLSPADFIQLLFTAKGVVCLLAGILLHLILIIVGIPVTVRRYHDLNMSGWWIVWFWLLGFIPVVGWISWIVSFVMLYFFDGTPRPNDFGSDPKGRGEQPRHPVVQSHQRPRVFIKTVPTTVSPQTRLSNLEQMLEKGLISEEEYEKKRSSILEQI